MFQRIRKPSALSTFETLTLKPFTYTFTRSPWLGGCDTTRNRTGLDDGFRT